MKAIDELRYCLEIIDAQRFDGFDQNPHGVRDLAWSAYYQLLAQEKALRAISELYAEEPDNIHDQQRKRYSLEAISIAKKALK